MISVNLVFNNFESLSNNNKKDLFLSGESHFDKNEKKFILEATITSIKSSERFSGFFFLMILFKIMSAYTQTPYN